MVHLASTRHPKCAAALVKNWLQMIGIITEDAHITNDDTQADEKHHGIDMVKELVRRQTHKGREVRRFGPYEHPGFLPRSSIDPGWWHWRRVFGAPWKDATEHINALELRALMAAVQWRLRVPANVHSKGLHISDSYVVLGAVSRGRSSSRRLRNLVAKLNSLMLAASFTGIWAYVRTDRNPADEPSREQ